jgi:hypothetical protein
VTWCRACEHYLTPTSIGADARCPRCGAPVEQPHNARGAAMAAGETDLPPVPWHFKLFLGAFAVYLGFRAYQMVQWLHH